LDLNGAIFDRLNDDIAGRSSLVDHSMKFAAEYLLFVVAAIVVASWFARFGSSENRRIAVYTAVIASTIALGLAALISANYDHPRPFVERTDVVLLLSHGADSGFPSDHTTVAFALAAGLGLYRARFGIVAVALASVIAFARVYVGVHYPGDVAGGALIGIGVAVGVWAARPLLYWLDRGVVQRVIPSPLL
jgi:undecaprenyl-diphosphatase